MHGLMSKSKIKRVGPHTSSVLFGCDELASRIFAGARVDRLGRSDLNVSSSIARMTLFR